MECQIDFGRLGLMHDPDTDRRRALHALIFTAVAVAEPLAAVDDGAPLVVGEVEGVGSPAGGHVTGRS